jgi:hypothetical protein
MNASPHLFVFKKGLNMLNLIYLKVCIYVNK